MHGVWHVEHCGCYSCLSIKECVSLLWPIRNRVIVTCSFRDFRKAGRHSHKRGLTWNSLLLVFLFQHGCHFFYGGNYLFWVSDQCIGCCTSRGSSLKPILLPRRFYDFLSPQCGLESSKNDFFDVECSSLIINGCSCFFLLFSVRSYNSNRDGWLVSLFNGISTLVGYLMPKPFS